MADNSTFTIRIEGLDKLQANFREAGVNYRGLFRQAMQKATQQVQNVARNNIRIHGTTYQGNMARGFTVREATESRGVVAESEKYGAVVEYGRKPGSFPPIEPLERWAKIKLGVPGLGFVIARKIKQKGTKAQPWVEPTFRSEGDFILQQFSEAAGLLVKAMAQ